MIEDLHRKFGDDGDGIFKLAMGWRLLGWTCIVLARVKGHWWTHGLVVEEMGNGVRDVDNT